LNCTVLALPIQRPFPQHIYVIFKTFLQYLPWTPPVTFHLFTLHIIPPHTTISTRVLSDKDILKCKPTSPFSWFKTYQLIPKSGNFRIPTRTVSSILRNIDRYIYIYIQYIYIYIIIIIIFSGSSAQRGICPPRPWGFLITYNEAPQSVGLLWTSDQLVAETSTWQYTTHKTDKHPCPRWYFFFFIFLFVLVLLPYLFVVFNCPFASYRTACCGFFHYEKSDGFSRERTRDLGFQRPARKPLDHRSRWGIRTHYRSRRAAVDLRLRPCGHWDRCVYIQYIHRIQIPYFWFLPCINQHWFFYKFIHLLRYHLRFFSSSV
jgi:hypothetical protein